MGCWLSFPPSQVHSVSRLVSCKSTSSDLFTRIVGKLSTANTVLIRLEKAMEDCGLAKMPLTL